jgi:hypothetical protein
MKVGFVLSRAAVLVNNSSSHNNMIISTKNKPNINYMLADDLGYGNLSCYGQTKFLRPNSDA